MHRSRITRLALVLAVVACGVLVAAFPAMADATYHTQHIELKNVGGAKLKKGFVQNIHANGPTVFALERYVLVGAEAKTEFQVTLQLRMTPDGQIFASLPTTTFWTNGAGNGVGHVSLPPSAADGLHGLTIYIVWELSDVETHVVLYRTALEKVTLD